MARKITNQADEERTVRGLIHACLRLQKRKGLYTDE